MNLIDHRTLANLVRTGTVRETQVLGQPGGWAILVKTGMIEQLLAATRSGKPRLFKQLHSLIDYLREIGIVKFSVDAANWAPEMFKTRRPDKAEEMRNLHAAGQAYEDWLQRELAASEREAADPKTQWIPHAQIRAESLARRNARPVVDA